MSARAIMWRITVVWFAVAAVACASAADRLAYQGRLVIGTRSVVVMSANGDNPVELPHPPGADRITPALSPDGSVLAYAAKVGDQYKLWTVGLADDNSVANEPTQLTAGTGDDEQPAWSADGRLIAYVSSQSQNRGLYVIPAGGGTPTLVTTLGADSRNTCPHWSPDGSSIVFSAEGKLFVISAGGGERRELVADGMYPSWSPDGREIAFFSRKPEPALMAIALATGNLRTIVKQVDFYGETAWSPDGSSLAFKADKVGTAQGSLWVVPAAGGAVKPVRPYGVAHGYLDWSRGGPVTLAAATAPADETTAAPKGATPVPAAGPKPAAAAAKPVGAGPAAERAAPASAAAPAAPPKLRLTQPKAPRPSSPPPVIKEIPKPPEAPPQLPPVRIISPAEGAAVRGTTTILASKLEPGGYVSFFVDGRFAAATIAPYEMNWDTRAYGDGSHTLEVIGYSPTGATQGKIETKVEVRNTISAETLPQEGVLLRYRYKPKEKWEYLMQVRAQAGAAGEVALPGVAEQGGTLEAVIAQRVEAVKEVKLAPSGTTRTVATMVNQVRQGTIRSPGLSGPLPQVGQASRSARTTDGDVAPIVTPTNPVPIALGNLSLSFPDRNLKLGDRWAAPMTVLPVLKSSAVARLDAEHRIENIEWESGHETLRIVSTFKASALPVGVQGMAMRDISGTRTTWFAYKEYRVVRMQDHLEGIFRQEEVQGGQAPTIAAQAPTPAAAPASGRRTRVRREEEEEEAAPEAAPMPSPAAPVGPAAPAAASVSQPSPVVHYTLDLSATLQ